MLGLLARLLLDARLASALLGGPWLVEVCERESLCSVVDVHEADRWLGRRAWLNAVRVGWLDPERCRWHRWEAGPWSTRGVHGLVAAYSMRALPCLPPSALALPPISAWAASQRAASWECDQVAACRRWRAF